LDNANDQLEVEIEEVSDHAHKARKELEGEKLTL
jgi:hypothetical protein